MATDIAVRALEWLERIPHAAWLCIAALLASEWIIFRQHQAPAGEKRLDQHTLRGLIAGMLLVSVVAMLATLLRAAPLPEGWRNASTSAGVVLAVAGILLRHWAVRTLREFFTVQVHIAPDHRLIESGPYRLIRHPSYTGLWMLMTGLGLGLGDWVGIVLMFVAPPVLLRHRLQVEESALAQAFPQAWPAYVSRTRKLIPFLW